MATTRTETLERAARRFECIDASRLGMEKNGSWHSGAVLWRLARHAEVSTDARAGMFNARRT
ncbi:predicted protein [Streptomyces pristinaespiralis ATCC 25486]|jgi:hypothetical protein|uniref:Predicted protein n=1 Tax=Streptomyces pristinaespiralis (strain ATCC 25486 / DSM 40338 / CBS 914.69 / JCM 4507 / KCC S-0507 / NBRC 13074 / NRRL 2958 / 5647) TaxID=457429 RepID=D6X738_STRE2|nr:predicted protein [Streptomyces pristinaespiralis ATCC 25486]